MAKAAVPTLSYRDEMAVIHRLVRRELRLLPPLVRAAPSGDRARAREVGSWAWEVLDFLHHHHEGEDLHLWPVLRREAGDAPGVVALVEQMEGQHAGLGEALEAATARALRWRDGASDGDRYALADALEALREPTLEHLDLEEAELCPLAEQHLSREQWLELSRYGQRSSPRRQNSYAFAAFLEEATASERASFVHHLPPPLRLLVGPMFERPYRRRMARVRAAG